MYVKSLSVLAISVFSLMAQAGEYKGGHEIVVRGHVDSSLASEAKVTFGIEYESQSLKKYKYIDDGGIPRETMVPREMAYSKNIKVDQSGNFSFKYNLFNRDV